MDKYIKVERAYSHSGWHNIFLPPIPSLQKYIYEDKKQVLQVLIIPSTSTAAHSRKQRFRPLGHGNFHTISVLIVPITTTEERALIIKNKYIYFHRNSNTIPKR